MHTRLTLVCMYRDAVLVEYPTTPFLRIFIPGRAALVMKLNEAYLEQVPALPKEINNHDGEVEECDKDFTKHTAPRKKSSKTLVRKVYAERETFLWGAEQNKAFNTSKMQY